MLRQIARRVVMGILKRIYKSTQQCLESIQFSLIRASMERESLGSNYWGVSRNENMHRMRTLARLHDSLFRIQMEIQEYEAKFDTLRVQAETSFRNKASETQQKDDFNKMRLVELQKKALTKSENILLFTLNGLEKKGYIQNINKIIQYTVRQHKMVQEEGLIDDTQHESLVDAFEQISSNVAKGHDILETLDSQSWNVDNDQDAEEGNVENDSAFGKWRVKMMLESSLGPVSMQSPVTINHQHPENNHQVQNTSNVETGNVQQDQPQQQATVPSSHAPLQHNNNKVALQSAYGQ